MINVGEHMEQDGYPVGRYYSDSTEYNLTVAFANAKDDLLVTWHAILQ